MKKVGVLYDNISGNIGDQAIGISVRKMLAEMGADYEELVPGRFNPADYSPIVVGGGLLVRPGPNFFYDKFRVQGRHILNCCGVVGSPSDLEYLNDYLYVTVRSNGDRRKLSYLKREVGVVPCTTMLLKDIPGFDLNIEKPGIGVHIWAGNTNEDALVAFLSALPFHVYFLPITHYNRDFSYMERLSHRVENSTLLPILRPEEVFTVIGRFDCFISMSLHGAVFAYVHNVPFVLYGGEEKREFFMHDRGLGQHLFSSLDELPDRFDDLQNSRPDYARVLAEDLRSLHEHKLRIADLLPRQVTPVSATPAAGSKSQAQQRQALLQERDFQVHYLQSQVTGMAARARQQVARIAALDSSLKEKTARVTSLETREANLQAQVVNLEAQLTALKKRVRTLEGRLSAVYSSYSWRIAAPLRGGYGGAKWVLRNTRRAFTLLGWLGTGQFSRAGNALLPYYQRYVPGRLRRFLPYRLREGLIRRLALPSHTHPLPRVRRGPELKTAPQPYDEKIDYAEWILRNDTLSDHDRLLIRDHIASFKNKPKISIVMPVHDTPTEHLQQAIDSILGQLYQDWELCIVDDASTTGGIRTIIEDYAQRDGRVRPNLRAANGGVSACTNAALAMATGDWTIFMDPADLLSEHALYLVAEAANSQPDSAIIYSDHDQIDANGERVNPHFKPDWDYDLFLGQDHVNPLCAYRADLVQRVGGIREGFDGAQYWDFALMILEAAPDARAHHIPFMLCHQRVKDSTSPQPSLASMTAAARRVVNEHFRRTGRPASAIPLGYSSHLRIKWDLPEKRPVVSIIIPTRDQCKLLQACIDGLLNRTDYRPLEIVIVDNGSSEPDTLAYLARIQSRANVKVVHDPGPFNFSRLVNLGVAASTGEICVLLNNDVDVINPDWLDEMVSHALRPEVGAVGAKLYYPGDTVQHGGVILGLHHVAGTVADHAYRGVSRETPGYLGRLNLTHTLSAVTAACVAVRREVYDRVCGFNERDLAVSFGDVDFCLRVRQAGYKTIWTPNAELYHYESVSRGSPWSTPKKDAMNKAERAYMRRHWGSFLDNDPYYNPNLSLALPSSELATTSRVRRPWSDYACSRGNRPSKESRSTLLHENLQSSSILRIPGTRPVDSHMPTVLVCAHQSVSKTFGAELSFLDILDGFAANGYNVVVVVPGTDNASYLDALISRSLEVVSFWFGWWRAYTPVDESAVEVFEALIDLHRIAAVHVNTIVLCEPLVAARRKKIPAVVHAREIVTADPWLCRALGSDADTIVNEVVAHSDHIIANSQATAQCYRRSQSVMVVPNTVDANQLDLENAVDPAEVRFALVSSNLPKKGLGDVIELAKLCEASVPNARFLIVGPDNRYVTELKNEQLEKRIPDNVEFLGYSESPREAMAEANVILNLSHFKESFGRTVIEGMAARRPVIAYDWGAPPELIRDGETGFVVGFRDMDQLVDRVRTLCENPGLISEMGNRGRLFVGEHYSAERFAQRLRDAYQRILPEWQPPRKVCDLSLLREARPTAIIIPVYNAYDELRQCIESVQEHTDLEKNRIIVVDDGSTDARVRGFLAGFNTIELVCNEHNIGFTQTCNKGIAMAATCDVVLLNSDTIVTPRWLESLRIAAYSAADIGTSTALSDNAGAFSVPVPNRQNKKPDGVDYRDYARLMRHFCGGLELPEVPTGNGFCMFIKRDLIDGIGDFDAAAFPRGYGEENDFCMRALKAGWRNVIAPAAFVFHHREASFGAEKKRLLAAGMEIIQQRYPDYAERVKQAFSSEAIGRSQRAAQRAAAAATTPPYETRIAVLTSPPGISQPGSDSSNRCFLVTVENDRITLPQAASGPVSDCTPAPVTQDYEQDFGTWLLVNDIDRVDIETPTSLPFDVEEVCGLLGIPCARVR